MKVHLIRIAMIVLAVVGALPATPVAARPKDPDSFQVTLLRQPDCHFGTNFVDPLDGLCPGRRDRTGHKPAHFLAFDRGT